MCNEYAILDVETTGLSPNNGDRLIEVAVVILSNGVIKNEFSTLINPERKIPIEVIRLTGIDDTMVKTAPYACEALNNVFSFIKGVPIFAHNASFDSRFLNFELRQIGEKNEINMLCTLLLSRRLFREQESYKLNSLVDSLGLPKGNSHRALSDAKMTAHLLRHIQEEIYNVSEYNLTSDDYYKVMKEPLKNFRKYGSEHAIYMALNRNITLGDNSFLLSGLSYAKGNNKLLKYEQKVEKKVVQKRQLPDDKYQPNSDVNRSKNVKDIVVEESNYVQPKSQGLLRRILIIVLIVAITKALARSLMNLDLFS